MMAKVALVTGGNRGLGFGFVEVLAERLGPDATVYLGARDLDKGREAAGRLRGAGLAVEVMEIDISEDGSVARAAETLRDRHGGVDIVVGNAALTRASYGPADVYIATNNLGTHRLIRRFGPILKDGARFLIVASCHGVLTGAPGRRKKRTAAEDAALRAENRRLIEEDPSLTIAPAIRDRMIGSKATLEEIEAALAEFVALREAGTHVAHGWPEWINKASKFGQIAATMVFARQMEAEARRRDILINVCCPGLVATDATADGAYGEFSEGFTPREAAENLVWIVTQAPEVREPYGQMLFHHTIEAVY
jgi:NAD(P)-dependent dehydrogenase (short-subunit alcohol dehydrogenase family)